MLIIQEPGLTRTSTLVKQTQMLYSMAVYTLGRVQFMREIYSVSIEHCNAGHKAELFIMLGNYMYS